MRFFISFATLASVAVAQYDFGSSGASSTVPAEAATTTSGSAAAATHTVLVGSGGLVFSPDTVVAAKGDTVQFMFDGGNHTVTEAAFNNPCNPSNNAFTSGFTGSDSTTFSIIVTSTDPQWFYCAQPGHCQAGMVGAINPPSSGNTLAAFRRAATTANTRSTPSNVFGGVISVQGSPASTAPGAATQTGSGSGSSPASTTSSQPSTSPSGNSAASLAGGFAKAMVGAVAGAAALLV
ncbi:hypothetical protein TWF696_002300 [Orbilia brochopaga]|uniref:Phytocyanin domain-containing protein n=1 Tax=Orbilia brochopaga TaxID=3140254 RepID=A0AAV9U3W4_9PEZI